MTSYHSILFGILMISRGLTTTFATLAKPRSYEIRHVNSSCSSQEIKIRLEFNRKFQGIVYAKGFPLVKSCSSYGTGESFVDISMDTSGCGVRLVSINDETLTFRITLNVQMDKFLQQITDLEVSATCNLPFDMIHAKEIGHGSRTGRKKISVFDNEREEELSNQVKTWMEIEGISSELNSINKVFVGEQVMMLIKSFLPESIDVGVVDCYAYDGTGEVVQKLLDDKGCPLDESLMPSLEFLKFEDGEAEDDQKMDFSFKQDNLKSGEELIRLKNEKGKKTQREVSDERGKGKESEEEPPSRFFQGIEKKEKKNRLRIMGTMFSAFKFPDTSNLHLRCTLQICRKICPKVACDPDSEPSRERVGKSVKSEKEYGSIIEKIEVFNSVEVLAPGIDADEFSSNQDEGDSKMSLEEDSFCLSGTKMALSFAILGAIFLCGVLAALWTVVRSHMRKVNVIDGSEQILVVRDSPLNFTSARKMHHNWSYS